MCQLRPGCFWNITGAKTEEIEKEIDLEGPTSDELRIELQWIDQGYIRLSFDLPGKIRLFQINDV